MLPLYKKGFTLLFIVTAVTITIALLRTDLSPLLNRILGDQRSDPSDYLSLDLYENSEELDASLSSIKCKPYRLDRAGHEQADKFYGKPDKEERSCDDFYYPDICSFQVTKSGEHKLSCDSKVCGSSRVQMGSINPNMGKISEWTDLSKETMVTMVGKAVEMDRKSGFGFLFIRCGNILQVLTFPPVLQKVEGGEKRKQISVNVISMDSLSRPHFYRSLPRTVEALRKIKNDFNIQATALDFQIFQSIGEQTFDNLRPFFCGVVKDDNILTNTVRTSKYSLGVDVLYETFQKWGYQTLFQEDLVWFDRWGIVLTDLQVRSKPTTDSEFKARWNEFKERMSKKHIDDFGMTHFSGPLLGLRYSETNHFENPPKVCLNGQFFSKYFMDYIQIVNTAIHNDPRTKPLVSFIHFNTGHEHTGQRIRNTDAHLAKFLINMAEFPNTLTMLVSDHGNKNTQYSYKTEEGKREVYDPIAFMVIPDGVVRNLGKQRMGALVQNQRRLFTFLDVHRALMSLNHPKKMHSQDPQVVGIFADLPANRTCADLNLMPQARCKCKIIEKNNSVEDNSDSLKWLAEFALGTLNEAIQKQHMRGEVHTQLSPKKYGYGNCQRLVGKTFANIVQRSQGDSVTTTMDLHVVPPAGYKEDEIFKVSVKQQAKTKNKVWLTSFIRKSRYHPWCSTRRYFGLLAVPDFHQ
ncbi:uncharacterized protein LOC111338367 isoform X2 [Stylophora pistillata]|uniref:uncharacterized protein LOC111338367 isoform X2 n=1 Tax=Stylophora pistillata TaxID=50429 RepID=UPI000C03CF37|nr:uncharacterized protein LOC111338367 isoform X2 [Stylophora pistillata]